MRTVRAVWRLLRMLMHLLLGMVIMAVAFGWLDAAGRQRQIAWWSARLLRVLGIELRHSGVPRPGATLLVANHVSWLDIAAIHAVAPHARFVAKADVLAWPLLGWLIRGAGTLFIERERKRDALRVLHQVADALRAGDSVVVFPEGTTGDGRTLLPFHGNLLQAAIASGTPVQPLALRYSDGIERCSAAVEYVGATTLLQSVWCILRARQLCAHVDLLSPQGARHADRRALAAYVRELIAAQLRDAPWPSAAAPGAVLQQPLSRTP